MTQGMQACVRNGLTVLTTEFTQPWEEFADLMVLDLTGCQFTNPDLMQLSQLSNVRVLNLSGTNITDDTINFIYELSSLTALYLQNTKVSAKGLTRLRKRLPCCGVIA